LFVALGIQRTMRVRHYVICGLSGSTIFFHVVLKGDGFREEVVEYEMYVLIFSTSCNQNTSNSKKNWARYDQ